MGERLPRVTADQTLRALRRAGWGVSRTRGSHYQLVHTNRPGRVTVAVHAGAILKPKTLLAILDQAGMSVDEFRELL